MATITRFVGVFLIGLGGWIAMDYVPVPGSISLVVFLVGSFLLAIGAGFVARHSLGILPFWFGIFCSYPVLFRMGRIVFLGENWDVYLVLFTILPSIVAFAIGLFIARRRTTMPSGGSSS